MRNLFFDWGVLSVTPMQVPVISVGNISTGGTGKTPFVEVVVSMLQGNGRKPSVVSRGYGRRTTGFQVVSNGTQVCAEASASGDEPALLAQHLAGVPVVVDEDRVQGASKVLELFRPDCIILDDGFQHRSLGRKCDIVLLTANELRKGDHLLPAGYRREPVSSLRRAQVIVISGCSGVEDFEQARSMIADRFDAVFVGMKYGIPKIRLQSSADVVAPVSLAGKPLVAFSGIAKPFSFETTLHDLGVNVLEHRRFPDHHWYSTAEIDALVRSAEDRNAVGMITTEKDAIRFESIIGGKFPLYVVGVQPEIIAGDEDLRNILLAL